MTKELIQMAHQNGLMVTFDPNPRPVLWDSEEQMIKETNKLACMCDVVMPGFREGKLFTGLQTKEEIADFYLNEGVKKVVIKLGTSGSYSKERLDDKKILERGNAIGAMQVMNLSDNEGLPTINGLNEFLKTYQKKN